MGNMNNSEGANYLQGQKCLICGEETRRTKKGGLEPVSNKKGFIAHVGCTNKNPSFRPTEAMAMAQNDKIILDCSNTNWDNYDIIKITLDELKRMTSEEVFNEKIMDGEYKDRNLVILYITDGNNKYHAVICGRTAYILKKGLSREQIKSIERHVFVTWSGTINQRLFYGPIPELTLQYALGWDYNHFSIPRPLEDMNSPLRVRNRQQRDTVVPLKYIYKTIVDILTDI